MIRPMGDRILIRRIAHQERVHVINRPSSGADHLILPPLPAEAPMVCEVLAVGPGKKDKHGKHIPIPINVGDQILTGRWGGTDVEVNGEKYRLLESDEVIGTVHGDGTLVMME